MTSLAEWLRTLGILGIATSLVAGVYWLFTVAPSAARDRIRQYHTTRERLRAYREIMDQVIEINRICVGLSERNFEDQMERLAFGNESDLEEPCEKLTATYQSYYHILDPTVREALSDYLNYLRTYHDEGPQIGRVLSKSGNIVAAMRSDLELESIYPDGRPED